MGCRIIQNKDGDACFYDSVTMTAFGPVIEVDILEAFEEWLKDDPRKYSSEKLWDKFIEYEKSFKKEPRK